jgi:hypothetical protein
MRLVSTNGKLKTGWSFKLNGDIITATEVNHGVSVTATNYAELMKLAQVETDKLSTGS